RVGISLTQRKLTLRDAVVQALQNNLEVEIERTNRDTAAQQVEAARGFFDPAFRWQPLLETRNTPTGSVLQGSGGKLTDKGFAQNFYFRERLPQWGTAFNVDFENSRQTTTNPFSSFTPLLNSRALVGISQPLVRGFRIDAQRAELRIRKKRVDLSNVDLEVRVIDVISRVEQGYWDLVAARQDVAVKEDSANLAREQLGLNQRLVESGTLARVELAAAEAELQRRLETWYSSIGTLTEVENN
ncbi:MAG: TolC family protein, partial [Bryobacteraceae bacterium]